MTEILLDLLANPYSDIIYQKGMMYTNDIKWMGYTKYSIIIIFVKLPLSGTSDIGKVNMFLW